MAVARLLVLGAFLGHLKLLLRVQHGGRRGIGRLQHCWMALGALSDAQGLAAQPGGGEGGPAGHGLERRTSGGDPFKGMVGQMELRMTIIYDDHDEIV